MPYDPLDLAHTIVNTLEERKGENILLMDLAAVCTFTDLFVICTAGSERTLKALSTEVKRRVELEHETDPYHIEGNPSSGWVLLDYGSVILHLFSQKLRDYYKLEQLWSEGKVLLRMP